MALCSGLAPLANNHFGGSALLRGRLRLHAINATALIEGAKVREFRKRARKRGLRPTDPPPRCQCSNCDKPPGRASGRGLFYERRTAHRRHGAATRRGCAALPTADCQRSSVGSARAGLRRFAADLQGSGISRKLDKAKGAAHNVAGDVKDAARDATDK